MDLYRIHRSRYPALDGWGAARYGGRWNPPGIPLVYASLAYEGALLEQLVRSSGGGIPLDRIASRIALPAACEIPELNRADHPDWRDGAASRRIGRDWVASRQSVALKVPSYVAQPWGRNVILNPGHPEFGRLRVAEVIDIGWDSQLF
ncbi:MAG: RES domain-containing protein [Gemmatimonadota bacterium]|nr:RES domain-containing protein [Gemmatimonadota bacterium]